MSKIWVAVKDPNERKDYMVIWEDLLAGDTITQSEWSIVVGDPSLVFESQAFTDDTTTIWLTGGKVMTYALLNRITTNGGRIYDQTIKLYVAEK